MKQENPILVLKRPLWEPEKMRHARLAALYERARRLRGPDGKIRRPTGKDDATDTRPVTVMACYDQLSGGVNMTPDEQTMVQTTQVWLKSVTNGLATQAGWTKADLANPDKLGSVDYWNFFMGAINDHSGWLTLTFSASDDIYEQTKSGDIDVSDMVKDAVTLIGGLNGASSFETLAEDMAAAAIGGSTGVTDVANFFWSHRHYDSAHSVATQGPVVRGPDGYLSSSRAAMTITVVEDDWRALFVKRHFESMTLDIMGVAYEFLPTVWATQKAQVISEVGQWVTNGTTSAPIGDPG